MRKNPEFVRNLWLRTSRLNLLLGSLLLSTLFLLALGSDSFLLAVAAAREKPFPFARFPSEAIISLAFMVLVGIVGFGRAGASVQREIKGHTWDSQRMSAITPWSMAWGKAIGANIPMWCCSVTCIAFYIVTAAMHSWTYAYTIKNIVVWIAAVIIAQFLGLTSVLMSLQKLRVWEQDKLEHGPSILFGLSCIVPIPVAWFFVASGEGILWFGATFDRLNFLVVSSITYAAWALVGAHFMMRREFRYTNTPLIWCGFAVFVVIYFSRFGSGQNNPVGWLFKGQIGTDVLLPLYAGLILLYGIAFTEPQDKRLLRRIADYVGRKDWRSVLHFMPRTFPTLLLVVTVGLWFIVAGYAPVSISSLGGEITNSVIGAALLFAIRDIGLIAHQNLKTNSSQADTITISELFVYYAAIPICLVWPLTYFFPNLEFLWAIFRPYSLDSVALTIGPVFLETALVYYLLYRTVRKTLAEPIGPSAVKAV